jgi:hypothetical protein
VRRLASGPNPESSQANASVVTSSKRWWRVGRRFRASTSHYARLTLDSHGQVVKQLVCVELCIS